MTGTRKTDGEKKRNCHEVSGRLMAVTGSPAREHREAGAAEGNTEAVTVSGISRRLETEAATLLRSDLPGML